jgi:integrase
VQANRVLATLRHSFNMAKRWGLISSNPVVGTRQNPEEGRERFLTTDELRALASALEGKGHTAAALALRFIMATGCRKSEALNATWAQIDLATGIWTKPSSHTKQKRIHRVPLGTAARRVLAEAQALAGDPFVFPGRTGIALVDIKKTFHAACKEAGIESLRIHDLRHTYASQLASAGTSLPIVGALLGHTQTATTARYAHLLDQPLRDATEIVSAAMTPDKRK